MNFDSPFSVLSNLKLSSAYGTVFSLQVRYLSHQVDTFFYLALKQYSKLISFGDIQAPAGIGIAITMVFFLIIELLENMATLFTMLKINKHYLDMNPKVNPQSQ